MDDAVSEQPTGTALDYIPRITSADGSHWQQPLRASIAMTKENAVVSEKDFKLLACYSASYPSGAYAGKMWRRDMQELAQMNRARLPPGISRHWLVWYEDDPSDPKRLLIKSVPLTISPNFQQLLTTAKQP